jgi:hypothetical protein
VGNRVGSTSAPPTTTGQRSAYITNAVNVLQARYVGGEEGGPSVRKFKIFRWGAALLPASFFSLRSTFRTLESHPPLLPRTDVEKSCSIAGTPFAEDEVTVSGTPFPLLSEAA